MTRGAGWRAAAIGAGALAAWAAGPGDAAWARAKTAAAAPNLEEVQPGDRALSCAAIRGQIDTTAAIMRDGRVPAPGKTAQKGVVGKIVQVGERLPLTKIAGFAASFGGPIGTLAFKAIDARQTSVADDLKSQARLRHDRLISLYDTRRCA